MLARINKRYVPAYWDDFFNDSFFNSFNHAACNNTSPAVNVVEDEKVFRIEVAVPGVSKKEINIHLENDVLTISSGHKDDQSLSKEPSNGKNENSSQNYMRREFSYSTFKRSFQLPETIDHENIRASHEAGVLTILLPKKEEIVQKTPKQIEIK